MLKPTDTEQKADCVNADPSDLDHVVIGRPAVADHPTPCGPSQSRCKAVSSRLASSSASHEPDIEAESASFATTPLPRLNSPVVFPFIWAALAWLWNLLHLIAQRAINWRSAAPYIFSWHNARDTPEPMPSPTVITIGPYHLTEVRHLAEGGYAYVSLVRDASLWRLFALKRMTCQTREAFDAAQREVALLEQLPPHPCIVEYFGSKVDQTPRAKTVYMLFEYCGEGHLLDLLAQQTILTEGAIVKITMGVAMALQHLHSRSPPVFHRDIKLENVLLGRQGLYKLCDFGSASTAIYDPQTMDRDEIVHLQDHIGRTTTLMYRAPEMVDLYQKQPINDKADIWMLGCVVYTLVFGEHPFHEASALAISAARFRLPAERVVSAAPKLIDLVFWMLNKDPSLRPSAEELVEILDRYTKLELVPVPKEVAVARDGCLLEVWEDAPAVVQRPLAVGTESGGGTRAPRPKSGSSRMKTKQPQESVIVEKSTTLHTDMFDLDPFSATASAGETHAPEPTFSTTWDACPNSLLGQPDSGEEFNVPLQPFAFEAPVLVGQLASGDAKAFSPSFPLDEGHDHIQPAVGPGPPPELKANNVKDGFVFEAAFTEGSQTQQQNVGN